MKMKNSGGGCVPRVKASSGDRGITVTPLTLLDRFRQAVLRILMISAVSKSTSHRRNKQTSTTKYYNPIDNYHSEAVADCIEFIRTKKALHHEDAR